MSTKQIALRDAFAAFPTGMAMIAARVDGQDHAMLANSFTSVSLDPPLVSMAFADGSTTWPQLSHAQDFGITILGEAQRDLVEQLRLSMPQRLAGVTLLPAGIQGRVLPDAAATFTVRPHQVVRAGDHDLVLFKVTDYHREAGTAPLTYFDRHIGVLRAPAPTAPAQG